MGRLNKGINNVLLLRFYFITSNMCCAKECPSTNWYSIYNLSNEMLFAIFMRKRFQDSCNPYHSYITSKRLFILLQSIHEANIWSCKRSHSPHHFQPVNQRHVRPFHQVGKDDGCRPGDTGVAMTQHTTTMGQCRVDEVCKWVEVRGDFETGFVVKGFCTVYEIIGEEVLHVTCDVKDVGHSVFFQT